jgi:hypothetical protein
MQPRASFLALLFLAACPADDAGDAGIVSAAGSGAARTTDETASGQDTDGDTDPDDETDAVTDDTDPDDGTETEADPPADTDDGTPADTDANVDVDESMSFFVTSAGNGAAGGNYGGLAGADARCQSLADAVGAGDRTWRAYLSTSPIQGAPGELVHARDRIGTGPWVNAAGELVADNVDALHADGIAADLMLTEQGGTVPSEEHDILTGSDANGMALPFFPDNDASPPPTCFNWSAGEANAWVWVGHTDGTGTEWIDAHGTSCDPDGLASTAGSGRLYCFAD